MEESSQSINSVKRGRPRGSRNRVTTETQKTIEARLGQMTPTDFALLYPVAQTYLQAFLDACATARIPVPPMYLARSRAGAIYLADNAESYPIDLVAACCRWCFSDAKRHHSTWARVPVNHLGTVINVFATYLQERGIFIKLNTSTDPQPDQPTRSNLDKYNQQ